MDVTIGVPTCGGPEWVQLAHERAIPSALRQGVEVIHRHADTLAQARNAILNDVTTELVVNLDADDELEPGYVDAMSRGTADIRAGAVSCYRGGRPIRGGVFMPRVWRHRHECSAECLPLGSWVHVGACARVDTLRAAGGWEEWPIYEDWALWLRCYAAGATFEPIHGAVYRQHLRPDSRNHCGPAWEKRDHWHREIVRAVLGEEAA